MSALTQPRIDKLRDSCPAYRNKNDIGQEAIISRETRSGDREIPAMILAGAPDRLANLPARGSARATSHLVPTGLRVRRNNHTTPSLSLVPARFSRLWSRQSSDLFDHDRSPYTLRLTWEWRDLPGRPRTMARKCQPVDEKEQAGCKVQKVHIVLFWWQLGSYPAVSELQ